MVREGLKFTKITKLLPFYRGQIERPVIPILYVKITAYSLGEVGFECPHCKCNKFFSFQTRPEVRQCKDCNKQVRLRAGTIMQRSHLPLLIWLRAIYLMTSGKRGISALELQRHLGLTRYETTLNLTKKIRRALWQRDEGYKLKGMVEVDGTAFGKRAPAITKKGASETNF